MVETSHQLSLFAVCMLINNSSSYCNLLSQVLTELIYVYMYYCVVPYMQLINCTEVTGMTHQRYGLVRHKHLFLVQN